MVRWCRCAQPPANSFQAFGLLLVSEGLLVRSSRNFQTHLLQRVVVEIFGDNGSSAEGQQGSISELLAQNGIANTIEQQMAAMEQLGGLDALGGPKMDNMYHAGWAWAGSTPLKSTKLVAAQGNRTLSR